MTLTVRDLIALLQQLPGDCEVTTWCADTQEELAVEQVITLPGSRAAGVAGAVVLGMGMTPGAAVHGADVVWTAHDLARRCIEAGLRRVEREWHE